MDGSGDVAFAVVVAWMLSAAVTLALIVVALRLGLGGVRNDLRRMTEALDRIGDELELHADTEP